MSTSAHIRALLRTRYAHPEWALCFEVANGTGAVARRYAVRAAGVAGTYRGMRTLNAT